MNVGSSPEAIKKIQEVAKINISDPLSFRDSMHLSLQVSECLPPIASAGFAKRKQFPRTFVGIPKNFIGIAKNF